MYIYIYMDHLFLVEPVSFHLQIFQQIISVLKPPWLPPCLLVSGELQAVDTSVQQQSPSSLGHIVGPCLSDGMYFDHIRYAVVHRACMCYTISTVSDLGK